MNNKAVTMHEIGTPFDAYNSERSGAVSKARVMPSPFSYLTMPMACTFVRNLNMYDDSMF